MSWRVRNWRQSRRRRRLTAALALLAYIVSAVGLPLRAHAGKHSAEPFPCMNHACGCHTAQQCWHGCCCMSAEAKLAWAVAHGVVPPAYAVLPAHDEHPKGDCHSGCACKHDCRSESGKKVTSRTAWVIHIDALPCRGNLTFWSTSAVATPPGPALSWAPLLPLVGFVSCHPLVLQRPILSPRVPPPRAPSA
jgi:hypothetical protein